MLRSARTDRCTDCFCDLLYPLHSARRHLRRLSPPRSPERPPIAFARLPLAAAASDAFFSPIGWDKRFCLPEIEKENFKEVHFFGDNTQKGSSRCSLPPEPPIRC